MSIRAISGGTTTYTTPAELLVKSDPYAAKNPFAERTSDMAYLVLRSSQADRSGVTYSFNINWVPPLGSKKYMVCLETFANKPSVYDLTDTPYTVGWSYRAANTFDSAEPAEATIAVGAGNTITNALAYGASFTANGGEPLGTVDVVLRDVDGQRIELGVLESAPKFILSLYLLPID